jgi:hypothetical protein
LQLKSPRIELTMRLKSRLFLVHDQYINKQRLREGLLMKNLLVVFSHGKESGPWGSKIRTLANVAERLGAQVLSVDYREHPVGTNHDQNVPGEADRRVAQLLSITPPEHR